MDQRLRITIVGAGRVGARLANMLHKGHDITIIDLDDLAFRRLDPDFSGRTIRGNGIDVDTLRSARVEGSDIFLALMNGDNRNLMAAQVAQTILGVGRVIAKVYDPLRAAIFSDLGLRTISPTNTGSDRLFNQIIESTGGG